MTTSKPYSHSGEKGNKMSTSPTENTEKLTGLPINEIEAIVADHDKAMREDMASEIVGGSRSKAITDVITVKAIAALIASREHQAIQAFGEKVLKELPNSQNGKSRVFTASLYGSAMGEGYKLGISDAVSVITSLMEGSK